MEFGNETYKVYIKVDDKNNIISVNSSAFITNTEGWVQIDEGTEWPKYMHAQGNYFDKSIVTEEDIYRYKYVDGVVVEKTEADIAEEVKNIPAPPPSKMEVLEEENKANTEAINALLGVE